MRRGISFLLILNFFLISGCNISGQSDEVKPLFIGSTEEIDEKKSDAAKQILISMEEVIDVKGINFEENIYIAVKVNQFDRFFLDRIRKQAHDKLKKRFQDANIHVSTDKKVFIELEKLEKEINENKISKKNIKKRVKKIESYMKG